MNLEIISVILLLSLIANLYFIYILGNRNDNKKCNNEIKADIENKDIKYYKDVINNLPFYFWFIHDEEVLLNNLQEDESISSQVINYIKRTNVENKNRIRNFPKIQNLIIDGKAVSFRIDEFSIKDNENKALFIARNIDEDEILKRELNGYIRMYRDLLDASSHAIAFYSKERRLIFYNEVFAKLWSLDSRWLDSKPLYDEILNYLIEKNFITQIDIVQYKKDQIKMFYNLIDVHNDFIYLPDDRIIRVLIIPNSFGGLLFSYEDITNRLIAERSYNHLIKVYRSIFDKITEAVAIFSPNYKLYMYNFSFLQLFKFDKNYLDSKPHLTDIFKMIEKNCISFSGLNIGDEILKKINSGEALLSEKFDCEFNDDKIQLTISPMPENLIIFLFKKSFD